MIFLFGKKRKVSGDGVPRRGRVGDSTSESVATRHKQGYFLPLPGLACDRALPATDLAFLP